MKSEIKILRKLIEIDSNCGKTNKEIIDFIENKLSTFECKQYKISDQRFDLYNLVVKIKGRSSNSPLVFVGHTDTVPASERWKTNPFMPVEKGGRIYGLGACDMKAGLTAMMCAALSLDKVPPQDIFLVFDADEEAEGAGGRDLEKNFSLKNARVIVAEPSENKIGIGQKGCIGLHVKTSGVALHSSKTSPQFNKENNAIYKALRIANALVEYEQTLPDINHPAYGQPTLNIGVINGGTGGNITAAQCELHVDRRVLPVEKMAEVYMVMKKIILSADPRAEVRKSFWGEPFGTDKNTAFVKQVQAIAKPLLGTIGFRFEAGWTEAAIFAKWGEAIIFGPGGKEVMHQANEYVELKSIIDFTTTYKSLMLQQ